MWFLCEQCWYVVGMKENDYMVFTNPWFSRVSRHTLLWRMFDRARLRCTTVFVMLFTVHCPDCFAECSSRRRHDKVKEDVFIQFGVCRSRGVCVAICVAIEMILFCFRTGNFWSGFMLSGSVQMLLLAFASMQMNMKEGGGWKQITVFASMRMNKMTHATVFASMWINEIARWKYEFDEMIWWRCEFDSRQRDVLLDHAHASSAVCCGYSHTNTEW